MVRHYRRTTEHITADRQISARIYRREQVDAEKIAEVLIRHALRAPDSGRGTLAAGNLQRLLTPNR
ncbi:hypothetical protein [Microlunatus speluncae]|uniref:hypothetical protein n=1 Tax=Microlunatus speluncae TaxID=2594267 RepID=UPI001266197B|nr:hypothetical protein [Microlunatus speluncae]